MVHEKLCGVRSLWFELTMSTNKSKVYHLFVFTTYNTRTWNLFKRKECQITLTNPHTNVLPFYAIFSVTRWVSNLSSVTRFEKKFTKCTKCTASQSWLKTIVLTFEIQMRGPEAPAGADPVMFYCSWRTSACISGSWAKPEKILLVRLRPSHVDVAAWC